MTYQLTTLQNGLRVASERLPGMETVAVSVSVDVGARHERDGEGGISHLLEHMAFKGTTRRSARQIAEEFDMIGGQFNAYTSLESTVYYTRLLKEHLPLAVDILADILQHSLFDEQELAREQGVISQEIAMHFDTPDDLIFDLYDETAFPDQPLGRSILGTTEQVQSYRREDLLKYMGKHYHPSRMVLSAAGNVNHAEFVSHVEQHFSFKSHKDAKPELGTYKGGDKRQSRKLEQLHLLLGVQGVKLGHPDFYALQTFSNIFGGGMSSRLFQEVREKRGLAYHVSSMVSSYKDCGMFSIYTATGAAQAKELPLILADELKRMADGVSIEELQRAKNQQKAELLMARESASTVAGWIGRHLLFFDDYIRVKEITKRIDAVTQRDIIRVAETLCAGTPTMAALGPVKSVPGYEKVAKRLAA